MTLTALKFEKCPVLFPSPRFDKHMQFVQKCFLLE